MGLDVHGAPYLVMGGNHPFQIGLWTVFLVLFWAVWSYFTSPLRAYPGPFLASKSVPRGYTTCFVCTNQQLTAILCQGWTNLWRLYHISQGSFHKVLERLHRQYGPVVRIGPNVLDLDAPEVLRTVFNTKTDWKKVRKDPSLCTGRHKTY